MLKLTRRRLLKNPPPISTHVHQSSSDHSVMAPGMVDVSTKSHTYREATSVGALWLPKCVRKQIKGSPSVSEVEFCTKKGPVFTTATIAGTQAAKATSTLIPFCHPLPLTSVKIDWTFREDDDDGGGGCGGGGGGLTVRVKSVVGTTYCTGVEMEALTASSVALLTCYDMLKGISGAVTGGMRISEVRLVAKSGGKMGDWKSA